MADDDFDDDDDLAPAQGGEVVDYEEDEPDVVDTEDGGAIVHMDDAPKAGGSEFLDNLAETLPEPVLNRIATDYQDMIARDKEAREKRIKQYEDGLKRTGLGDDAPGGAQFQGASRVVHPMLTEVCVDFSARVMKEINPPDGPVKSKIIGDVTKDRVAKANRKADFMNWQLTVQAPEFGTEMEQMETQLPLGGSQYIKVTWNEDRNRPRFEFIPIDDMLIPYAASSFVTAERKTHVQYVTRLEFERRVKSGMYRDVDAISPSLTPEGSRAAVANDKIEGRESDPYNQDGLRTIWETETCLEIDEDDRADGAAPYVVSIDQTTNKVLSIYRNWVEDDPSQEELQWIVEFPFVPWRGAYGIGISHMIAGLSGAATGALRALLDSAHIQNSASMIKLKGGTRGGQSLEIEPTGISEIEGGVNVDDIRKLAMPLPFNGPSPTLFQLLGFLVEAGKSVIRTTLDTTVDSQENVPVGTTLARIEQGMMVFSSIFKRQHDAMQRLLAVLHRLNGMYLDDADTKRESGSLLASRADFEGPMDVVPVSDPNIFSEAQRFAQTQAVAQRAQLAPDLYNRRKVELRILQTLKIPAPEELLAPAVEPKEENAAAENVKAALGKPIVAFPAQDHIAHLMAHLAFMESPVLGSSQLIAPKFLPVMLPHIAEHVALWYAQEVFETANEATGQSLSEMLPKTKDVHARAALDKLVAQASQDTVAGATDIFGQMQQVIAKAIQMVQQLTPPMPPDPASQVAMADVQMRGKAAADKNQTDQAKLQQQAQAAQQTQAAEAEREQMREEADNQRTAAEIASRERMNQDDNEAAAQIALLHLAGSGSESTDPNPQPRT